MVPRKRNREEMEARGPEPAQEPTMLVKLRNTWEFANLMQYIFIFGKAIKVDEELDIDVSLFPALPLIFATSFTDPLLLYTVLKVLTILMY